MWKHVYITRYLKVDMEKIIFIFLYTETSVCVMLLTTTCSLDLLFDYVLKYDVYSANYHVFLFGQVLKILKTQLCE